MQSSHFADARDLTTTTEASRAILDTATPRTAIVGAGFTGTLLAVHLLREARTPQWHCCIGGRQGWGSGKAHNLTAKARNERRFHALILQCVCCRVPPSSLRAGGS